jgi:flagellar hook-length control protein FliK
VSVVAEIRGGDIHLHLAGATEAGREALRAALPQLREDLRNAGFSGSTLDLAHNPLGHHDARPGSDRQPGHGQRPEPDRSRSSTPDTTAERHAPRQPRPGPDHQLDLHL